MLRKCANPVCSAQFRFLHQGKLFEIEVQYSESLPANRQPQMGNGRIQIERLWLCDECAGYVTLRFDRQRGLVMAHSQPRSDEVVTVFLQSSGGTVGEISRLLIRPLDLNMTVKPNRPNLIGGWIAQTREAA